MADRFLANRGSQWQFYRRVPIDLVGEIGCRFWRESLQTNSPELAEQRVIAPTYPTNILTDTISRKRWPSPCANTPGRTTSGVRRPKDWLLDQCIRELGDEIPDDGPLPLRETGVAQVESTERSYLG